MNPLRRKSYLFITLCTLFLIYAHQSLELFGWFEYGFVDYRVWLSTSTILRNFNWFDIYNTELLAKLQSTLNTFGTNTLSQEYSVLPFAYLPIFSLLALPFGSLNPKIEILYTIIIVSSLAIWSTSKLHQKNTLINRTDAILGSIVGGGSLLSFFFFNPSILLMICCTMALTFLGNGKNIRAGALFALTFAKPQIAVWILAGLFLSKSYRCFLSMLSGIFVLLILSVLVFGMKAHASWFELLSNYRSDFGAWTLTQPNIHMIWLRLELLTLDLNSKILIWSSILLFLLFLFVRVVHNRHFHQPAILLACSLLSVIITPHSHVHQTAIVTPFLLYNLSYTKEINLIFWNLYLYIPIMVLLAAKVIFLDYELMHFLNASAVILCTVFILISLGNPHVAKTN
jgi:hypothetical protein